MPFAPRPEYGRLVMIGDVGGPSTYHAGDEAMLAANLLELRKRLDLAGVTVLSRDPEFSARRYDCDAALPPSVVEGNEPETLIPQLQEEVARGPSGVDLSPAAQALLNCQGLVISGGGNLNSTWPELLYQRIALMEAAHQLGVPVVLVGQTLGPNLESRHRTDLFRALSRARFVGLRERDSLVLALTAGIGHRRIHYQLDDAFFLEPHLPPQTASLLPEEPWIAVTLTGRPEPREGVVRSLAALAEVTGAPLVLVPHAAHPDRDLEIAQTILGAVPGNHRVLPILDCQEVVAVTSHAELVVSNRYHPLVFATAAGVPALGLYVDDYTRVKLRGALAHAALQDWTLDAALAWRGELEPAARELWQRREEIVAHLATLREPSRALHERHWQMLMAALSDSASTEDGAGNPDLRAVPPGFQASPAPVPEGGWADRARLLADRADITLRHTRALVWQRDEATRYAHSLRDTLDNRTAEVAALRQELARRDGDLDDSGAMYAPDGQ